jgi:hypothetical protein
MSKKQKSKVSQAEFVRQLLARRCAVETIAEKLRKAYPVRRAQDARGRYVNAIAKRAKPPPVHRTNARSVGGPAGVFSLLKGRRFDRLASASVRARCSSPRPVIQKKRLLAATRGALLHVAEHPPALLNSSGRCEIDELDGSRS